MQKYLLQTLAPQLLYKRSKETPEHSSLSAVTPSLTSPSLVVTNDLIVNANKMSAQVASIVPTTTKSANNGFKESH